MDIEEFYEYFIMIFAFILWLVYITSYMRSIFIHNQLIRLVKENDIQVYEEITYIDMHKKKPKMFFKNTDISISKRTLKFIKSDILNNVEKIKNYKNRFIFLWKLTNTCIFAFFCFILFVIIGLWINGYMSV